MPNQPLPTPTPPAAAPPASAAAPTSPPQPPVPQPTKPPTSFTPTTGVAPTPPTNVSPPAPTLQSPPTPPKPGAVPQPTPTPTTPPKPPTAAPTASAPPTPPPAPPAGPPRPPAGSPPPTPPKPGAVPPATPTPSAPAAAAPGAKPAVVKKSPLRFLPFIVGALVIVGVIGFLATRFLGGGGSRQSVDTTPNTPGVVTPSQNTGTTTTITYWGLWEPSSVLEQVFEEFEAQNPGVNVEYTQQSAQDYRERLQTAIASGRGPDVFRYHATWVPMLRNELSPVPASVYSTTQFQDTFYPVAYNQLQNNGSLVGIPLMYDGLGLFYNSEMLRAAGVEPPTTWSELRTLASQLTVRSGNSIQRGGAALGNSTNVEHFADVIGLLMLQNGADPTNPVSAEARDALQFYTNFALVDKVWDETLPNSTTAFARGDVAMMFAPSWRALEVIAQNPDLEFGIAPVPKLGENNTAWATYWAEGVSARSQNKDTGWALLQYMSSPEVMRQMYSAQSEVRPFGEPFSRVDMANELADQPLVAPFLSDAPNANGWYMSTFTHDNGINDQIIKYYRDAVTAVLGGTAVDQALQTVAQGVTQVLRQYGVPTSAVLTSPSSP